MRQFLTLLVLVTLTARAQPQLQDERQRWVAEREALVQRFAAEEAACRDRFVVTPCVDDVRARRRQALAPLRDRELEMDDRLRHQRAVERQAAREARVARATRAAAAASSAARAEPPSASSAVADEVQKHQGPPPLHKALASAADRAALAAERAQAQQKRVRDTQRTQAEINRRQNERKAAGKQSQPLQPLPPPQGTSSGTP